MPVKSEQALVAFFERMKELGGPEVIRNPGHHSTIPDEGRVVVFDGEPGEPEVYLGRPRLYGFAHAVGLQVDLPASRSGADLDQEFALLFERVIEHIRAARLEDPTLGGVVEDFELGGDPLVEVSKGEGPRVKGVSFSVVLHYLAESPI